MACMSTAIGSHNLSSYKHTERQSSHLIPAVHDLVLAAVGSETPAVCA